MVMIEFLGGPLDGMPRAVPDHMTARYEVLQLVRRPDGVPTILTYTYAIDPLGWRMNVVGKPRLADTAGKR